MCYHLFNVTSIATACICSDGVCLGIDPRRLTSHAIAAASTIVPQTSAARLAADRSSAFCWPADLCLKQNKASREFLGWTAVHDLLQAGRDLRTGRLRPSPP